MKDNNKFLHTGGILLSVILLAGAITAADFGAPTHAQNVQNLNLELITEITGTVVAVNPDVSSKYTQQLLASLADQISKTSGQEKVIEGLDQIYSAAAYHPYGIEQQALAQLARYAFESNGAYTGLVTQEIVNDHIVTKDILQSIVNVAVKLSTGGLTNNNIGQLINQTAETIATQTNDVSALRIKSAIEQMAIQASIARGEEFAKQSIERLAAQVRDNPKGPATYALAQLAKLFDKENGKSDQILTFVKNAAKDPFKSSKKKDGAKKSSPVSKKGSTHMVSNPNMKNDGAKEKPRDGSKPNGGAIQKTTKEPRPLLPFIEGSGPRGDLYIDGLKCVSDENKGKLKQIMNEIKGIKRTDKLSEPAKRDLLERWAKPTQGIGRIDGLGVDHSSSRNIYDWPGVPTDKRPPCVPEIEDPVIATTACSGCEQIVRDINSNEKRLKELLKAKGLLENLRRDNIILHELRREIVDELYPNLDIDKPITRRTFDGTRYTQTTWEDKYSQLNPLVLKGIDNPTEFASQGDQIAIIDLALNQAEGEIKERELKKTTLGQQKKECEEKNCKKNDAGLGVIIDLGPNRESSDILITPDGKPVPQSQPTDNGGIQVGSQFIIPEPQPYLPLPQQSNVIEGFDLGFGEIPALREPTSELTEKEKQLAESIGKSIASNESENRGGSGGGSEENVIIIEEPVEGGGSGGGSQQENTQPEEQRSAS